MNKYKEAYDYFYKIYDEQHLGMLARHYIDIIYEAIDKANKYDDKETPKKPIYKDDGTGYHYYFCGNCNARVPLCSNLIDQIKYKYCPYCGEQIDWSDE